MRDIYDTAVESGYKESAKRLLSLLNHFVADPEPAVRQVFAEQLFPLAAFFLQVIVFSQFYFFRMQKMKRDTMNL